MTIENPIPPACLLLCLALPGVWMSGFGLMQRATSDRRTRLFVAPGVSLALWLVATHVAGKLTGSFVDAFVAGTLVASAVGTGYIVVRLRRMQPKVRGRPRWSLWLMCVAFTLIIVRATLGHFSDELSVAGHMSTIAQLQNGHYPPRFTVFPQYEFRYHYGFDVLCAMLSGLLRVSVPRSIDVATLVLFPYTVALLFRAGERFVSRRHAWTVAALGSFGGGIPFFCQMPHLWFGQHLLGYCKVDGFWLNPSTASYFFQHPFALGFPLGLCALLIFADRDAPSLAARALALGLVLAALILGQVVVLLTFGASMAAAECWRDGRLAPRRALGVALVAAVLAATAKFFGGFFAPAPYLHNSGLLLRLGLTKTLAGSLLWQAESFGVLVPLGLVGILWLKGERLFFSLLLGGCLLVLNTVHYAHSWDIVKFATVATFAASIPAGAALSRLLRVGATRLARVSASAGALLLLVGCVSAGLAFHAVMIFQIRGAYQAAPVRLARDDVAVVNWLRRRAAASSIVFRDEGVSRGYAEWGGLGQAWPEYPTRDLGFSPQVIAARQRLLASLPADLRAYTAQHIDWFVLGPRDRRLAELARRWVATGEARLAFRSGALSVIHTTR